MHGTLTYGSEVFIQENEDEDEETHEFDMMNSGEQVPVPIHNGSVSQALALCHW